MSIASSLKTNEDQTAIGEKWADFLNLKRSSVHPDRYEMRGGDKTASGVYKTLKRLINEDGETGLIK